MTKEEARKKLAELVEQFSKETNLTAYQEEDVKSVYIYPFLQLLGYSNEGKNHAEWEIHTESKTKRQKKVDYEISINSEVRFLVEAKRPSINLRKSPESIYQIKNYCLHKRVPIGLLTDFEEFMLYFNITSPNIDRPKDGLLKSFHYTEYLDNFDFIYDTLSKEAVLKDSLAILVAKNIPEFSKIQKSELQLALFKTKGREELDKEFLQDLDDWRKEIAQSLATNNKKLTDKEVTAYTQKLIDRVLFIKITEDKDITDSDFLLEMTESDNIWLKLLETFNILIDKFNGSLFTVDDKFTKLNIDNQVLYDFIRSFYFTGKKTKYQTPKYHFDYIPVEILGSIYERFLGQVVKIKTNRKISIEDKPEVKKAGGVYYTPEYIVKYIVKNTIGEKIKGKKPEEIAKMTFLDPACGSGSFLIGAFDYLIKYHEQYYSENPSEGKKQPDKKKKYLYDSYVKDENDRYILTTDKKAEILQNNIYGVDIDPQAVEVTKLSLYIKMIEEGQMQIRLLSHPVLPSMDDNIKCGNSLIGNDVFHNENLSLFEEATKEQINAFDWDLEFKDVFSNGRFDSVIGNPPWITLVQSEIGSEKWNYYRKNYKSTQVFKINTFPMFIERTLDLIGTDGKIGMIIPNRLLDTPSYQLIRKVLISKKLISEIVDIPKGSFDNVVAGNILIFLDSTTKECINIKRNVFLNTNNMTSEKLNYTNIDKSECVINLNTTGESLSILNSIDKDTMPLKQFLNVHVGMMIKDKFKYFKDKKFKGSTPIVMGRNFLQFTSIEPKYLRLSSVVIFGGTKNTEKQETKPKLFVRKTGNELIATIDFKGAFAEQSVYLLLNKSNHDLYFFCAIINSKLMKFYFRNKLITNPEAYPYIQHYDLEKIPIKNISKNKSTQIFYNNILNKTQKLFKLMKNAQSNERIIKYEKNELNKLIYKLYDLTDEEIKIVEELVK